MHNICSELTNSKLLHVPHFLAEQWVQSYSCQNLHIGLLYAVMCFIRNHSGYGLSQWERTLQCNVVSHWMSPYTEWHLSIRPCYYEIIMRWHWNALPVNVHCFRRNTGQRWILSTKCQQSEALMFCLLLAWLNHWGPVTHIRQLTNHHWFREWFVAWSAPSHYLNQCSLIVNWTLRDNLQWNINRYS